MVMRECTQCQEELNALLRDIRSSTNILCNTGKLCHHSLRQEEEDVSPKFFEDAKKKIA